MPRRSCFLRLRRRRSRRGNMLERFQGDRRRGEQGHAWPEEYSVPRYILSASYSTMFELYGRTRRRSSRRNTRGQYLIILGLFSGAGGRFRPLSPWIFAARKCYRSSIVYQLLQSIGHSTMGARRKLVAPHLNSLNRSARWRAARSPPTAAVCIRPPRPPMPAPMRDDWSRLNCAILENNVQRLHGPCPDPGQCGLARGPAGALRCKKA